MRKRVELKSPVREYCTPGSVRGAPGNRCPYLDTAQCKDTHAGLWWNIVGHGQELSVPADKDWRTLRVYVSGLQSGARFAARLSDNSAPEYLSSTFARGGCDNNIIYQGPFSAVYTVRFRAASAGQKLTVSWTLADEQNRFLGQAQLQAATLSRQALVRP